MKAFIRTLIALFSLSSYAAEWESYVGCYETIQVGGELVSNPHGYQSTVNVGPAFWYQDVSGEKIPALNFFIFTGQDGDSSNYSYLPIFLDRGERSSLPEGASASFKGDVFFGPQSEIWSLDLLSTLTEQSSILLKIEQSGKIQTPNASYDVGFNALLIKAECNENAQKTYLQVTGP